MKRVIIKNLLNEITHKSEMEDPTQWIADQVAANSWGLPERWKRTSECTPDELASSLEQRNAEVGEGEDPYTEEKLPATYTITLEDMTAEVDQENNRILQMQTLKARIKELDGLSDLTASEVKECIRKFIKFKILSKDLD